MKKIITLLVIIIVVGGLGYFGPRNSHRFEHHGFMDSIHHAEGHASHDAESHNSELDIDTSEFLRIHVKDSDINDFFVQFRTEDLLSFPCQNCHSIPLEDLQAGKLQKKAHWDITLNHAKASVMTCSTCHQGDNMNYLKSLNDEPISMDRSYELCGQCHSNQFKDWQGGAHGKNVSGWSEVRVVKNCVNCHNPHDPGIKSRWPSRRIIDTEQKTQ